MLSNRTGFLRPFLKTKKTSYFSSMSPPWIPQNLQKRLLLYILQQLSLFSGIDLPNLHEVSLTNVHLKDVHIDPEKFPRLPGLTLRDGVLRSVEVKGGVVGGVVFDVSGVDVVFSLNLDNFDHHLKQMLESLAQSTANLASTVFHDADSADSADSFDSDNLGFDTAGFDSAVPPRPSAFRGVMARAAEIALLRLSINIADIHIKFVSNTIDTALHVTTVKVASGNVSRSVDITGVLLSVLNPEIPHGHTDSDSNDPSESSDSDSDSVGDSDSDPDSNPLLNSTVFTHDEAASMYMSATSQLFARSTEQKIPPNDPNTLFHVDELHVEFEGVNKIFNLAVAAKKARVAAVPAIPTASIVFRSIAKVLKLKTHQLKKHLSAFKRHAGVPDDFDDIDSDIDDIDDSNDTNDTNDTNENDKSFLKSIRVDDLVISLTLGLSSTGNFTSTDDDVSISLHNTTIRQKSSDLVFGGIELFSVLKHVHGHESRMFYFDYDTPDSLTPDPGGSSPSPAAKADVRFELFNKPTNDSLSETTVLLSKRAVVHVNNNDMQYLANFFSGASSAYDAVVAMLKDSALYRQLKTDGRNAEKSEKSSKPSKNVFILQTSSFSVTVDFSDKLSVKALVFPVTFNKLQDLMTIQRILVSIINDKNEETRLLSIPNITLDTSSKEFSAYRTKTGDGKIAASSYTCFKNVSVGHVTGAISMESLKAMSDATNRFIKAFSGRTDKVNSMCRIDGKSKKKDFLQPGMSAMSTSSTMLGSHHRRVRNGRTTFTGVKFSESAVPEVAWKVAIEKFDVTVRLVLPRFGDISVCASEILVYKQDLQFSGQVGTATVLREASGLSEPFLFGLSGLAPILLFRSKFSDRGPPAVDVTIRKFFAVYRTQWLRLFEKSGISENSENLENLLKSENLVNLQKSDKSRNSAPISSKSESPNMDIRVSLVDFSMALYPGRLTSGIQVHVQKGNSDVTFAPDQFYVKSSFRDVTLFLTDNEAGLKKPTDSTVRQASTTKDHLLARGYCSIGYVNLAHVGVTVNLRVEEIKKRNERLGIRGHVSVLDLKMNSDDHVLEVCADSFHCLMQTVNDLKTPILFQESEKTRVEPEEGFQFPEDIVDQIKALQNGHVRDSGNSTNQESSLGERRPSEEFLILDEDYLESVGKVESVMSKLSIDEPSSSVSEASQITVTEEHFDEHRNFVKVDVFPVSVNVNLSKVKVFLYDGYDWKETRKGLRRAVKNVSDQTGSDQKCEDLSKDQKRSGDISGKSDVYGIPDNSYPSGKDSFLGSSPPGIKVPGERDQDPGDQGVQTAFLSIHFSKSQNETTQDLVDKINEQIQEDHSDTTDFNLDVEKIYKKLRLQRSKTHKILGDFKNIEVNVVNHTNRDPRNDETPKELITEVVNQIDVRIDTITVYDNVALSSWNKMITYMSILGDREVGTNMVQLSICNVRPDAKLAYTEAVIVAKLLPLRLHVDQDTLSFATRFFRFKNNRFSLPVDEPIFVQKLTVDPVRVKFDYKPKKVDYGGIRSGHNAELANFFILDGCDVKLGRVELFGVLGMPKLGETLGKIYGGFVQRHQLGGVLSGVSGVKSAMAFGGGFRDLVAVPVREYKRNGQLWRSVQKGLEVFARATGGELVKLGIKAASGTQVFLERSERFFGGAELSRANNGGSEMPRDNGPKGILETSQMLSQAVGENKDPYARQRLYSISSVDEVDEEEDMGPVLFIGDNDGDNGVIDDEDDSDEVVAVDEDLEKMVSLYANQPSNTREGLQDAYRSMGRNLLSTRKSLARLRASLLEAENVQEQMAAIARASPVVIIRPIIGTTEAVMKTLMGVSNDMDSGGLVESRDKWR